MRTYWYGYGAYRGKIILTGPYSEYTQCEMAMHRYGVKGNPLELPFVNLGKAFKYLKENGVI